ncbi:MAG: hypothetical protein ACYSWX_12535 [Planctomycetota bacterium]|jgi:hypothetical protein
MKSIIKSLGTVTLLSILASTATAFTSDAGSGPLCGSIEPVQGHTKVEEASECTCSGGVTISVGGGTATSKPGSLVCQSTHTYPSYDKFVPSPTNGVWTECEAVKFVHETRTVSTCDTSDCWDILIFSGGTPKCSQTDVQLPGGHFSYKAIGICEESPVIKA